MSGRGYLTAYVLCIRATLAEQGFGILTEIETRDAPAEARRRLGRPGNIGKHIPAPPVSPSKLVALARRVLKGRVASAPSRAFKRGRSDWRLGAFFCPARRSGITLTPLFAQ